MVFGTGATIIVPNDKQKSAQAREIYNKPFEDLTPQQANVAEFAAGHLRWKTFMENNVYKFTRQLPGANNPIVSPYRNLPALASGADNGAGEAP